MSECELTDSGEHEYELETCCTACGFQYAGTVNELIATLKAQRDEAVAACEECAKVLHELKGWFPLQRRLQAVITKAKGAVEELLKIKQGMGPEDMPGFVGEPMEQRGVGNDE